jgi:excisionase family DNA binding protein
MGTRRMLTVGEAADYIGVSISSIRKWSDRGLVQAYRTPGGDRRFSIDDLDELIRVPRGASPQTDPPERHRSVLMRVGGRDRRGSST